VGRVERPASVGFLELAEQWELQEPLAFLDSPASLGFQELQVLVESQASPGRVVLLEQAPADSAEHRESQATRVFQDLAAYQGSPALLVFPQRPEGRDRVAHPGLAGLLVKAGTAASLASLVIPESVGTLDSQV